MVLHMSSTRKRPVSRAIGLMKMVKLTVIFDSVLNPGLAPPAPANLDPTRSAAPAYPGASSVSDTPFTSAVPAATTTISVPAMATTASMVANSTMSSMTISGSVMPSMSTAFGGNATFTGSGVASTTSSSTPAQYTGGANVGKAGGFLAAAVVAGGCAFAM